MDVRQLRYFIAVAEERSITRAAARLHITQPPLSAQLAGLERELGARLLVRHRHGVDLTDAGQHLLSRAVRLVRDFEDTTESVRAIGQGASGRLALAFVPSLVQTTLSSLLRAVAHELPDVSLDLLESTPDEVVQRLRGQRVDAGMAYQPPDTASATSALPGTSTASATSAASATGDGLDVAVIAREPLAAVVSRDSALSHQERLDLVSLDQEPFILPMRHGRPGLYAHAMAACHTSGFTPIAVRETQLVQTAVALVGAGLGVTILPLSLALASGANVSVVPLGRPVHMVETVLLWRRGQESNPVLHRFLRLALATPEPDMLGPDKARHQRELGSI
jgi:DNA-binding transcriptional LysR family regulator